MWGWNHQLDNKLLEMDRRTRKLMAMNEVCNPNSDASRFYVKRKNSGRGLAGAGT